MELLAQNAPPLDILPKTTDLDLAGLHVNDTDLNAILSVDVQGWKSAIPQVQDHFKQFGEKLPSELQTALKELEASL